MNSRSIWIAALAAVMALIYFVSRPSLPEVSLVELTTGLVENRVSNMRAGTVEACQRSKLSLPIGGQIAELYVDEGEEVAARVSTALSGGKSRRTLATARCTSGT